MYKLYYLLIAFGLMVATSGCDKCKDVSCNGGTCEDGNCSCPAGFSGENCEVEDKCVTNAVSCLNGECVNGECDCEAFYYGDDCSTRCANGTYSSGNCDCNDGFEGASCETYSRDKFFGTYTYSTTCITQAQTSTISAHDDEEHPEWVKITNISADGDTKGYGVISGSTLTIPKQTVSGASGGKWVVESTEPATLSGTGFTLKINRKLSTAPGSGVPCTHVFQVQ